MDEVTPLSQDSRPSGEGTAARQRTPDRTLPSPGQPNPDVTQRVVPRGPVGHDAPTLPRTEQIQREKHERPRRAPGSSRSARRLEAGETIGHFRIASKLGEGGMGVVYKALDLERSHAVALKTLHRIDPDSVARIKNEFRAAADVAHQNLVTLYELFSVDETLFFTMELIDGVSFLAHVRDESAIRMARTVSMSQRALGDAAQVTTAPAAISEPPPAPRSEGAPAPRSEGAPAPRSEGAPPSAPPPEQRAPAGMIPVATIERLRAALRQLSAGVSALHEAGKLHRDLKPGNVMVTRAGRVVILDFSLAASLSLERLDGADEFGGTPAYMAPEQILGRPATPATDWYAVGVMLYQALAGRLPYEGSVDQIIKAKRRGEPPPAPSSLVGGVPQDLEALCMELLRASQEERPSGLEILARLTGPLDLDGPARSSRPPASGKSTGPISGPTSDAAPGAPSSARSPTSSLGAASHFIGRESHLAALEAAYRAVIEGRAATVYLHGRSGMGKSTLVRRFLAEGRRAWGSGGALVIEGRCYERESVPYKAFDSLVDVLARHLQRMPHEKAALLLPEGAHDLARLFPVLQGVEPIAATPAEPQAGVDLPELRRRAFRALKELLRRMGHERPLVVWIDDLQWGDRDSAHLLAELLAPPDAPALLLLGTYRTEEEAASPLLRELFQADAPSLEALVLEVGPLERADAERLALSLLGDGAERRAARIAEESHGSPLFVEELVRYAMEGGDGRRSAADAAAEPEGGVSLEALIVARLAALPEDARALLDVVALAGRPIPQGVAADAAGLGAPFGRPLGVLRTRNLVRTRGSRDADGVEAYHDRIRDVVLSQLGAEARARGHARLGAALEASGGAEPDALAVHFQAAGELEKAAKYAVLAAERAADALAFDRAADLYRLAVDCRLDLGERAEALIPLQIKRADALVNAGRCAEAAPIYLEAAEGMPALEAIGLRGKAAEQLLVSGRLEEGVRVLSPTLREVGLSYPRTPGRALLLVIGRMLRIAIRGIRFRERAEAEIPPEELTRLEVCWGAVKGLLSFDSIRAASFLLKYVLLALAAGEPRHIARALTHFGMVTVYEGTNGGIRKGTQLMEEAERIAGRLGPGPYLNGVLHGCKGIASIAACRFRDGFNELEAGVTLLKGKCSGVRWEVGACTSATSSALLWLGELRELKRRAPAWLRESEQIGDLYGTVDQSLYCAAIELSEGDPEAARARVRAAVARWTADAFTFQHWVALKVEVWCDLYEGDAEAAERRVAEAWSALEGSKMLRVRLFSIDALFLRGSVALAAGAIKPAERDARALAKLERGPSGALGDLLAAGALARRGDAAAAAARLDAAIAGLDAAGLALHAACARRRKGELTAGAEGAALMEQAEARMRDEGIADPARWRRIYTPSSDR